MTEMVTAKLSELHHISTGIGYEGNRDGTGIGAIGATHLLPIANFEFMIFHITLTLTIFLVF